MNTVQHIESGIVDIASQPSFFRAVGLTTEALGWPVVPEALAKFAGMDGHPDLAGVVNALSVFGYEAHVHTVTPETLAQARLPTIVVTLQGHSLVVHAREQDGAGRAYSVTKVGEGGDAVQATLPESRVGGLTGAALVELSRPPPKRAVAPPEEPRTADSRADIGTVTPLRQPIEQEAIDSLLAVTPTVVPAPEVDTAQAPPVPGAPSQSAALAPVIEAPSPSPSQALSMPPVEPAPPQAAVASPGPAQQPAQAQVPTQAVGPPPHPTSAAEGVAMADAPIRPTPPRLAPVLSPTPPVEAPAAPSVTPTAAVTAADPGPMAPAPQRVAPAALPSMPTAASTAMPRTPASMEVPPQTRVSQSGSAAATPVRQPRMSGDGGTPLQQGAASASRAEERYLDTLHATASDVAAGESDKLCLALAFVTGLLGHPLPAEAFAEGARRRADGRADVRDVLKNLQDHDFYARLFNCPLVAIPADALPMVLFRKNGDATVALARLPQTGKEINYQMWLPELGSTTVVAEATLDLGLDGTCLFLKAPFSKAEAELARLKLMYADLALEYRALKDANLPKP